MTYTLTTEEVTGIHDALSAEFANGDDPISPPGVKSFALLDSAVNRQHVGLGVTLKYEKPVESAATLAYGICSNHPFNNGNKRTALVSMLCHLDRNDLTFVDGVGQSDLYSFILKVASHGFANRSGKDDHSDAEIMEMAKWIRRHTRKVEGGERIITFRELRSILVNFGFVLENPKHNMVDVVQYTHVKLFGLRVSTRRQRISHIGYPGDGVVVGRELLKKVRKDCNLTSLKGIDSQIFYSKMRPPDYFIQKHQGLLRRLAAT